MSEPVVANSTTEAPETTRSVSIGTDDDPGPGPGPGTAMMGDGQQHQVEHGGGSVSSHRRLVFFDPIAFRYLEEDPATTVIDRRRLLEGYELYVVEEWACSRTRPTFLVCTYTGDRSKTILVSVLSVPAAEKTWSPRLKIYMKAVSEYGSKETETRYGAIMVTNLSSGFPPDLTVIPVPDGDVKKHREDFLVNENLKRMGCTGRAAITLQAPQASTVAKFHQLYHTSESAGVYAAVMELVKLCQAALVMYDKLDEAYVDGMLCDFTQRAIGDWWTDIGVYFYNTDPSDGMLGPTTVAAILGLFIGAYNRLKSFGAPVGKDILDRTSMKRAIGHFQKAVKMPRTRRLDRGTLDRLHRATAKAASGEGWAVGRALKSTVSDVTGKGGEMVMGIVGRGDKAAISAAETLDIDELAQAVVGPKMKWLWQGKSRPVESVPGPPPAEALDVGRAFATDDQGFIWTTNRARTGSSLVESTTTADRTDTPDSGGGHGSEPGRTGFSRIKETARGLKSHTTRGVKEGGGGGGGGSSNNTPADETDHQGHITTETVDRMADRQDAPLAMGLALQQASPKAPGPARRVTTPISPHTQADSQQTRSGIHSLRQEFQAPIYQHFHAELEYAAPRSRVLRRSVSALRAVKVDADTPRQNRLNRQLSFSLVEESVLRFRDAMAGAAPEANGGGEQQEGDEGDEQAANRAEARLFHGPVDQMTVREARIVSLQKKARLLLQMQRGLLPFTESTVAKVNGLDHTARQHLDELNALYAERLEEFHTLRITSADLVEQERGVLTEALRRVEVLANKLDYELDALQGRLQEVDDGVGEFELSVRAVEARVRELVGKRPPTDTAGPWWRHLLIWPW